MLRTHDNIREDVKICWSKQVMVLVLNSSRARNILAIIEHEELATLKENMNP